MRGIFKFNLKYRMEFISKQNSSTVADIVLFNKKK